LNLSKGVTMTTSEAMDWNEDVLEGIQPTDLSSLVVYSRDWTIETIYNQIEQKNIDLNPQFQRRNAWTDDKRSRLIESLIIGNPVPEIVLAEHPQKKKSFIVIDGKQRLLTIAGFIDPKISYWKRPSLAKLDIRKDLNGIDFVRINKEPRFDNELREFMNADIRCTIISNYSEDDVLYDIFYRLNTGSVPLSTQELRQVLNKGEFADYLMQITNDVQPIHAILKLDEPDARLRDIELILRFIAFTLFGKTYKGNLKKFLDSAMGRINGDWDNYRITVEELYNKFNKSIRLLNIAFGNEPIGHKYTAGKWEGVLNKVLFEVEAYYFTFLEEQEVKNNRTKFIKAFKDFCSSNYEFRESIRISTSNLENYQNRFKLFRTFINKTFGKRIKEIPIILNS